MISGLAALPDVDIEKVPSLPNHLDGARSCGLFSTARPGALLRVMPGLGTFLATGGRRLRYAMAAGADPAAAAPLLQGPLCAALIYQRGEFPLHAATLVPPGGGAGIALAGDRGAGKSTLAYALVERGWRLLNDDLSRLVESASGDILVVPGRAGIRLTPDACARFGLRTADLVRTAGAREKYLLDVAPAGAPHRLAGLLLLDRGGDDGVFALRGAEAARAVSAHTYRPAYVGPLGMAAAHFMSTARIATRTSILRLRRNAAPRTLAEEVERVAARALQGR
jgi:hypothetical protein